VPDFPYINARVRAMRSRLLTPAQFEDMLAIPTLPALLQALASTPYAHDLQEALTRHDGIHAVDEALARNLHRTTQSILEWADGEARDLILVMLVRWDVVNLRTIARGTHVGRSAEEIAEAFLPAGTLSEVVLREMAGQASIAGLAGSLEAVNHPLAEAMSEAAAVYATTGDLPGLELQLDRAFVGWGRLQTRRRGRSAAALRRVLQIEIDLTNVKTALRLAAAGDLDEEVRLKHFIPGGVQVTAEIFAGLSASGTQAKTWKQIRTSGSPLKDPPSDLVAFERELDRAMAREFARHYRGDPLGLDIVIGYLAMKTAEVANLRLIARGKSIGLAREAVRRELVLA
jgi:V/A-type H+-transporting ATPase subunit C